MFLSMKKDKIRSVREKRELFKAKFLEIFLELLVKKGLTDGSNPDKKNLSKLYGLGLIIKLLLKKR